MGVEEFYKKFEPVFMRFAQGYAPTGEDKGTLTAAIAEIKDDSDINIDKTTRENYYRALGLATLWLKQRIVDQDLHTFFTTTLVSFGTGRTLGPKNEFFYKETTQSSTYGLFENSRAEVWFEKGEECLFVSAMFREYLEKPRQIPGLNETRYAGQQAFLISADLYSRQRNAKAQQRAHLAINIRLHYKELEYALHEVRSVHLSQN